MSYLTTIVEERWNEAIASPDINRWHNLAGIAAQIADALEHNDPDNLMIAAHRGVYQEAYKRYLDMQKVTA